MRLSNPYKQGDDPPLVRKIIADVGVSDWNRIYLPYPFRGAQDAIFSSLVYSFVQAVKEHQIPTHYEPENASRIESLLLGITYPRVD